jgi:hypothetical protein
MTHKNKILILCIMVKYYGRARQRTGAVNRNQPGLKKPGCVTGAGRPTWISRYIKQRVNCNARVGCVNTNGVLTGKLQIFSNGKATCVTNTGFQLIPKAPRSRGCAGGVHRLSDQKCI